MDPEKLGLRKPSYDPVFTVFVPYRSITYLLPWTFFYLINDVAPINK